MTEPMTDPPAKQFTLATLAVIFSILAFSMAIARALSFQNPLEDRVIFFAVASALLTGTGIAMYYRKWNLAVAILFGCTVIGLLMPAVQQTSGVPYRVICQQNLKQLALAIHNYESDHKRLPASSNRDHDVGYPYSWRVAILPYIEQQDLYDLYRFDEPWDGPNNSRLASYIPPEFQCSKHTNRSGYYYTPYVAVSGPGTMFPNDRHGKLRDAVTGQENTILLVESPGQPVHWMQPGDISLDELVVLVNAWEKAPNTTSHQGGVNFAMADASNGFHRFSDGSWTELEQMQQLARTPKANSKVGSERD